MAECSVCNVEFDIGSMGVATVESHGKGEKHKRFIQRQMGVGKFQCSFHTKQDGHTAQMSVIEMTCVTLGF